MKPGRWKPPAFPPPACGCSPRRLGAATVTVRFMTDGATETGIPSAADVEAVQGLSRYVRPGRWRRLRRCAGSRAPRPQPSPGLVPDTSATRAAVAAELADLLYRQAAPGGLIYKEWVDDAISTAAGVTSHDGAEIAEQTGLTIDENGNLQYGAGYIPVPGEVIYV